MKPDDELCLCFHVTKRKVINYLRIEKPRRAAQLSDCFGAGTGCGWCRPYLARLFQAYQEGRTEQTELPDAKAYGHDRQDYIAQGKGTPPNRR